MKRWVLVCIGVATVFTPTLVNAVDVPIREQAIQTLDRAGRFFHSEVTAHGGYVWRYSSDLQCRQGKGPAYDKRIRVQPPGTPAVGLAFLDAYPMHSDVVFRCRSIPGR